jgi:hypothetical protein
MSTGMKRLLISIIRNDEIHISDWKKTQMRKKDSVSKASMGRKQLDESKMVEMTPTTTRESDIAVQNPDVSNRLGFRPSKVDVSFPLVN